MEFTSGLPLSLVSPKIWKGTNQSNGQLALIHNYHLAVGYSKLIITSALQAELTAAGEEGVPFGNGLFYDRNLKATAPNTVYAGVPTAVGAKPRLAGVLAYDAAIPGSQPVSNKGVLPYTKGEIIKRGFVRYKFGKAAAGGAAVDYADIDGDVMCAFVENSTGDPVFAAPTGYAKLPDISGAADLAAVKAALSELELNPKGFVPTLANCTFLGYIVNLYPEDESVLVELAFK